MVIPKNGERISKIDAYLNCAENFAYRSTCIKRKYGAVIVKDDAVISTGYNGSPRGLRIAATWEPVPGFRKICTRERDMVSAGPYMHLKIKVREVTIWL